MNTEEYKNNKWGKVLSIKDIKEDIDGFAKLFSEGNKGLEKCLKTLWDNDIETISCCGDRFYAYLSISMDDFKKPNTLSTNIRSNLGLLNQMEYDANYYNENIKSNHVLTIYCNTINPNKFFEKMNYIISDHIDKYEQKFFNINLKDYSSSNPISNRVVTSDYITFKGNFSYRGKEYDLLNFKCAGTKNSLVLYDKANNPHTIAGYIVYDSSNKYNNVGVNWFSIEKTRRSEGLGSMMFEFFKQNITKMTDLKDVNHIFVHASSSYDQKRLEDFYIRQGCTLTPGDVSPFVFDPKAYKQLQVNTYQSLDNYIEMFQRDSLVKTKNTINNKDLDNCR